MQSEVYEYFLNNHKDILICEDDKEAFKCSQATKFAGYESFLSFFLRHHNIFYVHQLDIF